MEDLVGLPWSEAEPLLAARGQRCRTVITSPPGSPVGGGELRVVAVRPGENLLILAYRRYEPAPGPGGGTRV